MDDLGNKAKLVIALLGALGAGSIVTAYVELDGRRELAATAQAHEIDMTTQAAERETRKEFLAALRESQGNLADRVEVLTFYAAVLRQDDPLRGWVQKLHAETVAHLEDAPLEALANDLRSADTEVRGARTPEQRQQAEDRRQTTLARVGARAPSLEPTPAPPIRCPAIPPLQDDAPTPAPRSNYVWAPGDWQRPADDWKWLPGHWERARKVDGGALLGKYVRGDWQIRDGQCHWVKGHFVAGEPAAGTGGSVTVRDHRTGQ